MRPPGLAAWILLAWSPAARATGYLLVSAEGDVRILLDGRSAGDLTGGAELPVAVATAGPHQLAVETVAGTPLAQVQLTVRDEQTLRVHWTGAQLEVADAEESSTTSSAARGSGPRAGDLLQGAELAVAVASAILPTGGTGGLVLGSASALTAGASLARGVRDAQGRSSQRPPPSGPVHEEHDLAGLAGHAADPYAAVGGRPAFDASLCAVTFMVPAGLAASVVVDGLPMASLGPAALHQTVLLAPGLHTVQVLDAASGALLARGHLDAAAGQAFDLTFSATAAPVASQPGVWR